MTRIPFFSRFQEFLVLTLSPIRMTAFSRIMAVLQHCMRPDRAH